MAKRLLLVLIKLAINAAALLIVDTMFEKIWFDDTQTMIAAAILLALVNSYLRPLVIVLTLPINILTLGSFTLIINALMLELVSWLIPAFHVEGFGTAVGGALVMSLISFLLNWFLRPDMVRVRVGRW